jgi:hypothetical protein
MLDSSVCSSNVLGLENGHPVGMPNKEKANLEQTCFDASNLGYHEHKIKKKWENIIEK